jgi:hypothetical protein
MDQTTLPGLESYIEEDGLSPAEAQLLSVRACEEFEARLLDPAQGEALSPLAEGYLDARARGFDWRKALYIAWARLPREARWPTTLGELASVMGLRSDRAIRVWRSKNPEIDRLVQEEMLARVGSRTADVLDALAELASQADYKSTRAMELYLRVHGIYTPEQRVQAQVEGPQFYIPETAEEEDGDGDE